MLRIKLSCSEELTKKIYDMFVAQEELAEELIADIDFELNQAFNIGRDIKTFSNY